MWLRDTGILNKLWDDELNAPLHIPDPKVRINEPLDLYQVGIAFMVAAGGLIIALLGFLMELCYKSRRNNKGEKKQVSINFHFTVLRNSKTNYIQMVGASQ